jgi:cysteinyl-tRNA synthetase
MNDDLAVPTALAVIAEIMRTGNSALATGDIAGVTTAAAEIRGALDILGCDPFDPIFAATSSADNSILDGLIALALEQRAAARTRKDFAAADAIRDQIAGLGVVLEDTAQGTRWSIS